MQRNKIKSVRKLRVLAQCPQVARLVRCNMVRMLVVCMMRQTAAAVKTLVTSVIYSVRLLVVAWRTAQDCLLTLMLVVGKGEHHGS